MLNKNFKITTYSPIHIGSGNQIKPLEFLLYENKIVVLNMHKIFELSYFDYEMFLTKVEKYGKNFYLSDALSDALKKKIFMQGNDYIFYNISVERLLYDDIYKKISNGKFRGISEFIKTKNQPYIPGSSIKGSITTAVIDYLLSKDNNLFDYFKELIKKFIDEVKTNLSKIHSNNYRKQKKELKKIEQVLIKNKFKELERDILWNLLSPNSKNYSKNSNYSISRAFSISDSLPWEINSTKLAKIYTFSLNRFNKLEMKNFINYLEIIPASRTTSITIRINDELYYDFASKILKLREVLRDFYLLKEVCNSFTKKIINEEKSFFNNLSFQQNDKLKEINQWYEKLESNINGKKIVLNTGWGGGSILKTVLLNLEDSLKKELRWLGKMGGLRSFGKVIHKDCSKIAKKGCEYEGNNKWKCNDCNINNSLDENHIIMHDKYPKSRRLFEYANSYSPLGWITLEPL